MTKKPEFDRVIVMTCPKGAFPEVSKDISAAKKELAAEGIKLVVMRYNNNSSAPRFEAFDVRIPLLIVPKQNISKGDEDCLQSRTFEDRYRSARSRMTRK